MRNEYIGLSIDGDHAARCNGVYGRRDDPDTGCGCANRQPRNACGCEKEYQPRNACGCEKEHQPRNACGCEKEYQPGNACGCEKEYQSRNACGCEKHVPGMVYAEKHDLADLYCAREALARGTLFACLDKPMCNDRCSEDACLEQWQAEQFAIWELRLYLNTHPCDKQAMALLRQLIRDADKACGCSIEPDCARWSWTDGPWPWEYQRCCGKEA